ncbi:peroxisomal membrane protein pex14 [Aspergillus nanangensis]|uniref:Peroxisomal membrane protein PEX14 n=1 Tax=Aspergillus nanangensis TaxID=2582783 RepID=A0AAD4GV54_ASPNN|nr:peroxisomal membrane protein pex14 [Aspergillus nanangensis]
MAREELISSAVTFLQDPSVASSPIEKRVSFLQSKNLTKEEIDLALARVGEDPSAAAAAAANSPSGYQAPSQQQVAYRPPPQGPQGYGYPPYGQWQQPPPEPPKRDWRDLFIMATMMGGVGYGLYFITKVRVAHLLGRVLSLLGIEIDLSGVKRYISPLIAPPTPPQLEQDKQNIDEQFSRAFALIEQLSTDTASLKSAEEARTERLDSALREVESLVTDLKSASRRRDDDTRRISDEVKSLKDAIPKALEGAREGNEGRLRELGTELKSLKTLLGNRLGSGSASSTPALGRTVGGSTIPSASRPAEESSPATPPTPATPAPTPVSATTTAATTSNGATATATENASQPASQPASNGESAASPAAGASSPTTNPMSQFNRSASIPAWQMAAANRSKAASPSTASAAPTDTSASEQPSAPAS